MSSEYVINLENVSKHYLMYERPEDRLKQMVFPRLQNMVGLKRSQFFTNFSAVENVSLKVKKGQTVGIIGRNGSGKSTLLQMVCGTLNPTAGEIKIQGRVAALLELGAGFNPEFTGRQNVFMNAAILGLSNKETKERFESIEKFADIGVFINQPVKTYSSGMFVRLAFAVATSVDPDILIVDEALSVGDEAFQRKCFARIEKIKDNGCTILFVSHSAQTIVQLCDRAILLDAGELLLDGEPKQVVAQYQRLVNANTTTANETRQEIKHMRDENLLSLIESVSTDQAENNAPIDNKALLYSSEPQPKEEDTSSNPYDFLDESLKSQSSVKFDQQGAEICDLKITTLEGTQVNVLKYGQRYIYEYKVAFSEEAYNISCGMMIKTISGLELAGAANERNHEIRVKHIPRGKSIRVKFEFSCYLLPGKYFTNAGIFAAVSGERRYMHRILDGLLFRVIDDLSTLDNGHFGLNVTLETTLL